MLEIRYNETIHKADELQHIAEDIERICNHNIAQVNSAIRANWQGDGGSSYQQKLSKSAATLVRSSRDLHTISLQLESKARALKRIEELARTIWG